MTATPGIAAFFDIDGTLLAPPSLERRFLRCLRWRGGLTAAHGAHWLRVFFRSLWRSLRASGRITATDWLAATHENKAHLAGLHAATLSAWTDRFVRLSLGRPPFAFFPAALRRLEWHAAQGHRLFLVSGTPAPLAEGVAQHLAACGELAALFGPRAPAEAGNRSSITVCATELEVVQARWTGKVVGEAICGPAKARALVRLAAERQLDLRRSYAFGDSWSDRWMLECVGHPAAVNPSKPLAWLARRRGWPVLWWSQGRLPRSRRGAEGDENTAQRNQGTEESRRNSARLAIPSE